MTEKGIIDSEDIKIPDNRFASDKTIVSANFGKKCTSIGNSAFEGCALLKNFNDDNEIHVIGNNAFKDCLNLSDINLNNCTTIGDNAFEDCSNLFVIDLNNCTTIGNNAFKGCSNLYLLSLNKCESIGNSAFNGCFKLLKIFLPVCENIGSAAFNKCEKLNKIYITNENQVCEIDLSTNYFNNKNTFLYVNSNMIDLYKNNPNLSRISNKIIPIVNNKQISYVPYINTIKIFGKNENFGKYGILTFNDKVKYLTQIFKNNKNLTHIDIPSECEQIIESCFEGCENLLDITLSSTLKIIEDYAFKNCKNLISIILPESLEELEEGIFAGCEKMEYFVGKFSTYNRKAIVSNNKLICLSPKSLDEIHDISLIDKSIKRLGKCCFYGCENITTVHIPSNIISIGNYAFEKCKNIKYIYFYGNPPIIGIDIFKDTNEDFKIFVPENLIKLYTSLYSDEKFINKIESFSPLQDPSLQP